MQLVSSLQDVLLGALGFRIREVQTRGRSDVETWLGEIFVVEVAVQEFAALAYSVA